MVIININPNFSKRRLRFELYSLFFDAFGMLHYETEARIREYAEANNLSYGRAALELEEVALDKILLGPINF
jgi:hypothetical protein